MREIIGSQGVLINMYNRIDSILVGKSKYGYNMLGSLGFFVSSSNHYCEANCGMPMQSKGTSILSEKRDSGALDCKGLAWPGTAGLSLEESGTAHGLFCWAGPLG
ncbi:hypothetical protein V6N13_015216 [Hibiscus sabdariffa]